MPSAAQVEPGDAAELARRNVPAHAVIGEVGERMAERRQLPVENGEDPRLGRMEDRVVETVVAVHDRGLVARRDVLRQPGDQVVHRFDRSRSRRPGTAWSSDRSGARCSCRACRSPPARPPRSRPCAARRSRGSARPRSRRAGPGTCPAATGPRARGPRRSPSRRRLGRSPTRPRTARRRGHREAGLVQRADDAELAVDRMRRGQQLGPARLGAHRVVRFAAVSR